MTVLEQLEEIFREALSIEPPPPSTDLIATGLLDSLSVVTLLVELEQHFGVMVRLENIDLESLRTLDRLAALVNGARWPADGVPSAAIKAVTPAVLLREGIGARPLFMVHTVEGSVAMLRPLALALETARPIYGLQARGLDPSEEPRRSVEEMAAAYIAVIRSVQPEGPYALCGYSFGGLVAFEMACRLAAGGEQLDFLALVDPEAHPASLGPVGRWCFRFRRPLRHGRYLLADPRRRMPLYARRAAVRLFPRLPIDPPGPEQPTTAQYQRVKRASDQAARAYRPGLYEGDATLFLARTRAPGACSPKDVWSYRVRGELATEHVPGRHAYLLARENLGPLSRCISSALSENSTVSVKQTLTAAP